MAVPTVTETITIGGEPARGRVDVTLVAATGNNDALGYATGIPETVGSTISVPLVDGTWAVPLRPNEGVSDDVVDAPQNSVYRLRYLLAQSDRPIQPVYISVPDQAGPLQASTLLTVAPIALAGLTELTDLIDAGLAEIDAAIDEAVDDLGELTGFVPIADVGTASGVAPLDADAKVPRANRPDLDLFNVVDYGAVGNGSADDTAAVQAAITAAGTAAGPGTRRQAGHGRVLFPQGTYRISSTLVCPAGVSLMGIVGNATAASYPRIAWAGASGGTMLRVDNAPDTARAIASIENLGFVRAPGLTNNPRYCIDVAIRADRGFVIRNVGLQRAQEHGIYFRAGGHNIRLEGWRADAIGSEGLYSHAAAIGWKVGTVDSVSLAGNWTVDNVAGAEARGGVLYVDATSTTAEKKLFLAVRDGKFENNSDIVAGGAAFRFDINATQEPPGDIHAEFTSVYQTNAGTAANTAGILVNPSYEYLTLSLRNCQLNVAGIPSYTRNTRIAGAAFKQAKHVDTTIAPWSTSRDDLGLSPGWNYERFATEIATDVNYLGPRLYRHGLPMATTILTAPTDTHFATHPTTVFPGQLFRSAGVEWEVTAAGTLGTLTGVTGDQANNSPFVTLSDASGLTAGDYITIGGVARQVSRVDGNIIRVSANMSGAATGLAVAFAPPTFTRRVIGTFAYPPLATGRYYRLPNAAVGTSNVLTNGALRVSPKFIPAATTLDRLGIGVQAAGDATSVFRIGVYADDGTGRPGALVLDAGTVGTDTVGEKVATVNLVLEAGWYFFGGAVQGVTTTQPTIRTVSQFWESVVVDHVIAPVGGNVAMGFQQTGVTGVLPATFTPANTVLMPSVYGRVA